MSKPTKYLITPNKAFDIFLGEKKLNQKIEKMLQKKTESKSFRKRYSE